MTNWKQSEPHQAGLWSAKARAINESLAAARTPTINRDPARSATFPSSRAGQRNRSAGVEVGSPGYYISTTLGLCVFLGTFSEKLPMQHAIANEATKKAAEGTF
ncbi:hypothetical protein MGU_09711 [Metarhizium guizhouense ARSEF 977]|uniref:Uncharacterized protein n=1 Tax=Metarhizium guizhouense (strain ARSEF 977) TaxID=1276136 RepID=A0A0B4G8H4_METGA|nr:hypothetical protein MGU_09711 [Metarhizium guizhouense ARSEF 977]